MLKFSKRLFINELKLSKFSKYNFARKVNNSSITNTTKLFSKFSIEEEISKNSENSFKKVIKKQSYSDMNSLEEKRMNREIEERISKGENVKDVIQGLIKGQNKDSIEPSILNDRFKDVGNSELMNEKLQQYYEDELLLIKKSKFEQEDRKKFSIDAKSFEERLYEDTPIYKEEDLKSFHKMKKQKNSELEEKDAEKMNKYKIKSKEEDETGESFRDKSKTNEEDEEDPQFKKIKNEFNKTFNKNKKKKSEKRSKNNSEDEEENMTEMRNLRKIKNITSPEYYKGDELINNSTDLVDTIPDIDIVEKRENNMEFEEQLKSLISRDLHPYDAKLEKKDGVIQDAMRLSKMNTLNIVNVKVNRNEIFKKRALELAKLWQMDARETKHWYYRLRREDKLIFKVILMKKKLEQKRKLKKVAKAWKIENSENIEINYLQMLREEKGETNQNLEPEKLEVPKHYKNVNEFIFFGEDTEFFRHYKRTCKNILNSLNKFFKSNKMGIKRGIGRNVDIIITEVKMNKGCTVVYAWWDLPVINSNLLDLNLEDNDTLYKQIELNLNQAVPFIKGIVTREVGLKYTPDIRFIKDSLDDELSTFENEVKELIQEDQQLDYNKSQSKQKKILRLLDSKEIIENIKLVIDGVKNETERNFINSIFFGNSDEDTIHNYVSDKDFNLPISVKIFSLHQTNSKLYEEILNFVKSSLNVNESNIDEYYEQNKELREKVKNFTKFEEKQNKKKEKLYKKMNIKEDDLTKVKKINLNDSVNNFLNQYDRKIPGQFTLNPSLKEMKERKEKKDFVDGIIERRIKGQIKSEIKSSIKIGKSRESRRNKAAEFWNKLDNQLL